MRPKENNFQRRPALFKVAHYQHQQRFIVRTQDAMRGWWSKLGVMTLQEHNHFARSKRIDRLRTTPTITSSVKPCAPKAPQCSRQH
jgi:hypothetical protein